MNHFLFSPWVGDFEDNDEKEAKAVLDAFKERLDWEKVQVHIQRPFTSMIRNSNRAAF
jgi:hypothetical protein